MFKFYCRKSLLYLIIFQVIYYIRTIEVILMDKYLSFNAPIILTTLMSLGEIFGGLIAYLFVGKSFKKGKNSDYFGIKLITNKLGNTRVDNWPKIILLIFFAGFFDFIEFVMLNSFVFKINNFSMTINQRYSNIQTISTSLLCTYALRFKIGKHQIFSIICMSILFVFQIILEIIYSIEYKDFFIVLFINILNLILVSFTDIIEKYLGDVNFSNPFGIIMGEGIFIFIMNSIYSIWNNPFAQILQLYETFNIEKFILLILLLFLFMILSAIVNLYKIHCNIFLSPVKRAFSDYLVNPFFIIYFFFFENDFTNKKGEQSITFFILYEIMSIISLFIGFIYNEYIILLCFGLEHDTIYEIDKRANDSLKETVDNDDDSKYDDYTINGDVEFDDIKG
mgnify:CR=1 FL=1